MLNTRELPHSWLCHDVSLFVFRCKGWFILSERVPAKCVATSGVHIHKVPFMNIDTGQIKCPDFLSMEEYLKKKKCLHEVTNSISGKLKCKWPELKILFEFRLHY